MSSKVYYKDSTVKAWMHEIIRAMAKDEWRPDYIVGLTRGGLIPAVMMSHTLDIPMHTLEVKLRDHANTESNLWMAEDAFGYHDHPATTNILIVDDINDSGATLNWIKQDWQSSCLPNDPKWADVWNTNVRIATLFDNESSKSELVVDYTAVTINKAEEDVWIDFPWESWWKR